MNKRFKIEKLPKKELPDTKILNQLKQCQRKHGLIYSTYKSLILKKDTINSDILFDKINNFNAYCIKDTFKNDEIVSWCIYIKGEIENNRGIQSMYFTRPLYRGLGLGSLLFSKVVNYAKKSGLPIWIYPYNDNKWFFRKIKNKYKNIIIENIYKI